MAEIFQFPQRRCRDCEGTLAPLTGPGRPPVRCPDCRTAFLTPTNKRETGAFEPCLGGCGAEVFTYGRQAYCEVCRPLALKADQRRWFRKQQELLAEYKLARGCANPDCDVTGPAYVLDAHHLDPSEKECGVGNNNTWAKRLKELQKCVILCANCHRKVEAGDLSLDSQLSLTA